MGIEVIESYCNQILRNNITGNISPCGIMEGPHCGLYFGYGGSCYGNQVYWNNITDNTAAGSYGIYNSGYITVDARWNWWGDDSGPYHPADNPSALGDAVSCGVDFSSWATTQYPYTTFPYDTDDPVLMDRVDPFRRGVLRQ